jgi:hypothetical protein
MNGLNLFNQSVSDERDRIYGVVVGIVKGNELDSQGRIEVRLPALVPPHSTVVGCGVHLTGQHIVGNGNHTTRYSGHTACHTGTTVNCGATLPGL